MHRKNGGRLRGDLLAHLFSVDAKRTRIAVGKYWSESVPSDRVRCGVKRETWQDDFAMQIQRLHHQKKSRRAAGDCHAVFHSQISCRRFFKLSDIASRSKLLAGKDCLHVAEKFRFRYHLRNDERKHLFKCRASTGVARQLRAVPDSDHFRGPGLLAYSPIVFAGNLRWIARLADSPGS